MFLDKIYLSYLNILLALITLDTYTSSENYY